MYCRKCGKQIPDDSSFCQYCREKVVLPGNENISSKQNVLIQPSSEAVKKSQQVLEGNTVSSTAPIPTRKKKKMWKIIIPIFLIVIVASIVIAIHFIPSAYSTDGEKIACWVKYIGSEVRNDGSFAIRDNDNNHYQNETDDIVLFGQEGEFSFYEREGKVGYLRFQSKYPVCDEEYTAVIDKLSALYGDSESNEDGVNYWYHSSIIKETPDAGCDVCFTYVEDNRLNIIWAVTSICGDLEYISP